MRARRARRRACRDVVLERDGCCDVRWEELERRGWDFRGRDDGDIVPVILSASLSVTYVEYTLASSAVSG